MSKKLVIITLLFAMLFIITACASDIQDDYVGENLVRDSEEAFSQQAEEEPRNYIAGIGSGDRWFFESICELVFGTTHVVRAEVLDYRVERINTVLSDRVIEEDEFYRVFLLHTVHYLRVLEVFMGTVEVGDVLEVAQRVHRLYNQELENPNKIQLVYGDELIFFLHCFEANGFRPGPMALEGAEQGVYRVAPPNAGPEIVLENISPNNRLILTVGDLMWIRYESGLGPRPTPPPYTPPTITGPSTLDLQEGYSATNAPGFIITGDPPPTITISHTQGQLITWHHVHSRLNIAAGIPVGTYTIELAADNGIGEPDTHIFVLTVSSPLPPLPPILLGDVNGDGSVNMTDLMFISMFITDVPLNLGRHLAAADINGDGLIDFVDATLLNLFLAGHPVPYPIGQPITGTNANNQIVDASQQGADLVSPHAFGGIMPFSSSTFRVEVSDITVINNNTVDITISLTENPGVFAFGFEIAFDDTIMYLQNIAWAEDTLFDIPPFTPYLANPINAIFMAPMSDTLENITNPSPLITLTFQVLSNNLEDAAITLIPTSNPPISIGPDGGIIPLSPEVVDVVFESGTVTASR